MYYCLTNSLNQGIDLKKTRSEYKVCFEGIESVFSGFNKGAILFKYLLSNEQEAEELTARHANIKSTIKNGVSKSQKTEGDKQPNESKKPRSSAEPRRSKKIVGANSSAVIIAMENEAETMELENVADENNSNCMAKTAIKRNKSEEEEEAKGSESPNKKIKLKNEIKSSLNAKKTTKVTKPAKTTTIFQNKLKMQLITKPVVVLEDTSEQPLSLTCKQCNHLLTTFELYDIHMVKAHSNLLKEDQQSFCLECEQNFENMNRLKSHFKEKHQPELPLYKCKECTLCFQTLNALRLHARSAHDNRKPFMCKECGCMVSSEPILRKHMMLVHSNEKPFECEHCKQKFKLKTTLKVRHCSWGAISACTKTHMPPKITLFIDIFKSLMKL